MVTKAGIEARNRYNEKNYDRINLVIAKGCKERIKAAADRAGQSMAEYICAALTAYGCPVTSKIEKE